MRLFILLTIPFILTSVVITWVWQRYQGHPVPILELVDRYWLRFILAGMATSLLIVGLEGGYLF